MAEEKKIETITLEEHNKVVAEKDARIEKLTNAVNQLLQLESNRYINDLVTKLGLGE